MNNDKLLDEIRDLNLSYLVLAQGMIRQDKAQAMYRLGLSEGVTDIVAAMSTQQLVRVASRNHLMCGFRFDDEVVWSLLGDHGAAAPEASAAALHASVLMAGRHAAAMGA